jgi:hypothetical protein
MSSLVGEMGRGMKLQLEKCRIPFRRSILAMLGVIICMIISELQASQNAQGIRTSCVYRAKHRLPLLS